MFTVIKTFLGAAGVYTVAKRSRTVQYFVSVLLFDVYIIITPQKVPTSGFRSAIWSDVPSLPVLSAGALAPRDITKIIIWVQ